MSDLVLTEIMGREFVIPVHPAAEMFSMLSAAEIKELAADIGAHGLQTPIAMVERGDSRLLLDGLNRLAAIQALGKRELMDAAITGAAIIDEADAIAYVVSANIYRRHLTTEQKRELIGKLLEAQPNKSDREIGRQTKTDHKTVAKERAAKERRGEIPHIATHTDSKGREQPAQKKPPPPKVSQESVPSEGLHDPALPANNPGVYEELIAAWDLTTTTEQARFIQERIAMLDSVAEARRLVEQFSQAEHDAFVAWFEHRLSSSAVVPEVATAPEPIAAPIPATPEPEPTSDAPSASDEPPAVPPRAQEMFDMWSGLKQNTRGRLVKWIEDDCPAEYPTIDNIGSMKDSARPFRELVSRTIDETAIEAFLKLTRGEQAVQW